VKVLVTGMSSRQANPQASKRDVTFAHLLATALREAGHEVEHRDPRIEEALTDFSHIFVGLGPLHGLGTNRMYGALSAILRAWGESKLTLFIDDVDAGKIVSGIKTISSKPERFTKPFYAYKQEHALANTSPWREWLLSGVRLLEKSAWPRLLLPAFEWADQTQQLRKVEAAAGRTVTVDLTSYLPEFKPSASEPEERLKRWTVEALTASRWLEQQRLTWPVDVYNRENKRPHDEQLVEQYRRCGGVLELPNEPGWWTSRIGYAAQAGAIYCTAWQNVQELGEPYTLLPDTIEAGSDDERRDLAQAQQAALTAAAPTRDSVKNKLNNLMGG